MDKKYLAEIRTRAQEAKAEKQKGNGLDCACLSWAIVLNDIHALLAEVERLTDIEKEYVHYRRLSEESDQQIITLKRALKIASAEANKLFSQLETFGIIKVDRKVSCDQENIDVWIQQAQEQEEKE